jgi:glycogen operon protein
MRRFWRGDENIIGDVARAMTASALQFQHDGRSPRASINHVTVHDGFTLADWASYEHKHNEANGEDNRDGSDDNLSVNCGAEGPTDNADILALRRRLRRNQLACLFLAQGIPLLLAGDEVDNSQNGNNNAYAQDNETGWVDWSKSGSAGDLSDFVGDLARLRREFPQLRPRHWLEGRKADGSYDVKWLTPAAAEMTKDDWDLAHARFLFYVLAAQGEAGKPLLVVLNGADTPVEITAPEWQGVRVWRRVLETADGNEAAELAPGDKWNTQARCVLAFAGEP